MLNKFILNIYPISHFLAYIFLIFLNQHKKICLDINNLSGIKSKKKIMLNKIPLK